MVIVVHLDDHAVETTDGRHEVTIASNSTAVNDSATPNAGGSDPRNRTYIHQPSRGNDCVDLEHISGFSMNGAWLIMLLSGQGKKHASSRPLKAKAQLGDGTSRT